MITLKRLTRGAFFMEYQKKYRNPKNESEDLIVSWERGYREVQIHYRDQLVGVVSGIRDLLKGKAFTDPSLGSIEVKLEEDPYFIQLIATTAKNPKKSGLGPRRGRFGQIFAGPKSCSR